MTVLNEIWKDIRGYEGLYQVSNLGRVRSLPHSTVGLNGRVYPFKGKLLKPQIDKAGYCRVSLHINSIGVLTAIHRLVGIAFIPNPKNFPEINHKFGIKSDNRASELEWCNRSFNQTHAYRVLGKTGVRGIKNKNAKLTPDLIHKLKQDYIKLSSFNRVGKLYGVSNTQVWRIITNKSWNYL